MRYMLLIYLDEKALSEDERQACYAESSQLAHDIKASGQYLAASPLQPTSLATIRPRCRLPHSCGLPMATSSSRLKAYTPNGS